jgi:hypothetical protein
MLRARARARSDTVSAVTVDGSGRVMAILGRVKIRAAALLRASALTGTALLVSGCAVFSPMQTDYDYEAADGVRLSIVGLELRNLLVVVPAPGETGIVVGQAVNKASSAVDVTFAVEGATSPTTVTVPANSGDTLSGAAVNVEIPGVPVAPGGLAQMTVTTDVAGVNLVQVPVLPTPGFYSGLSASS